MKLLLFLLFVILTLVSVRGTFTEKLNFQNDFVTSVGGPFESSNSNSRYALTYSLAENRSVFFSENLASFSAPDIVHYKGKFFSIFLPGVSFLGVPFYLVGKSIGMPQLVSYFLNFVLLMSDAILVYILAKRLKSHAIMSLLAAFLFVFATNSLAYSQTFTQHLLTAFLLLSSVNIIFNRPSIRNNLILGILIGYSLLVDIPNFFILAPVALYWVFRHFNLSEVKIFKKINFSVIFISFGLIICLGIFGYYNFLATGSPTKIGQQIGQSNYPPQKIIPAERKIVEIKSPFESKLPLNSRHMLNGFYILLVSDERGIFYYSPILFIALLGLFYSLKSKETRSASVLILTTGLVTILTYSMFGDPWGGWSFGARYMIPVIAILCPFIGVALTVWRKNILFLILVGLLAYNSVSTNVLGAITTNAIPPKQEAEHLITPIPYTIEYNHDLLKKGRVSSLAYNMWLKKYVSPMQFYNLYVGTVLAVVYLGLLTIWLKRGENNE